MFVALGTRNAVLMRHSVICGLFGSTLLFHIISKIDGFLKKKLQNIKCVLIFSATSVWNCFHSMKIEGDIKKCILFYCKILILILNTHFNENWTFSSDFRKIFKYQISWKSVRRETSRSMRTERRTDRHDEDNSSIFFSKILPTRQKAKQIRLIATKIVPVSRGELVLPVF